MSEGNQNPVYTDNTLSGDGTVVNPLGFVSAPDGPNAGFEFNPSDAGDSSDLIVAPTVITLSSSGSVIIEDNATNSVIEVTAAGALGFNGATPIAKPTVTGSRGGNAALASLLTKAAALGLITDSTTP